MGQFKVQNEVKAQVRMQDVFVWNADFVNVELICLRLLIHAAQVGTALLVCTIAELRFS